MTGSKLGIGFIGSGFVAKFHLEAWRGVRDADVLGVYSPNTAHAEATAARARELRVGNARAFKSIEEMIAAPEIDCVWLCGPNHLACAEHAGNLRCDSIRKRKADRNCL